jgi:integrase
MVVLILVEAGLRASEAVHLILADLPCVHGHEEIEVRCGKGRQAGTVGISSFLTSRIKEYAAGLRGAGLVG